MSFWSIVLTFDGFVVVVAVVVAGLFMRWVGGEGQDNCIICHVPFLSAKFLLCCNSPSSNWIHPSVLHSATAAFVALCIETDSCKFIKITSNQSHEISIPTIHNKQKTKNTKYKILLGHSLLILFLRNQATYLNDVAVIINF